MTKWLLLMVATWIIQRCQGCGMNALNRLWSPKHSFNYFVSYHADNNNTNTKVKIMWAIGLHNYPPNPDAQPRGTQTYRIPKFVLGYSGLESFLNCCHNKILIGSLLPVAYSGIFFEGGSTNSVEDRENGDLGGGNPLVRGSGGSCNLVQEISFHIVKFS